MEDWFAMCRRRARQAKRNEIFKTIKDTVGGIIFFGLIFLFAALCTIGSGYHWE